MRILIVLALGLIVFTPVNAQQLKHEGARDASYCVNLMAMHGMLSRAQSRCGFSKYSDTMIANSKGCYQQLGEDKSQKTLKLGVEEYNKREQEMGHDGFCQKIQTSFPNIIGK